MFKINNIEIKMTKEVPQKEGLFLHQSHTVVDLIRVTLIPHRFFGGQKHDSYYGVLNYRNQNVMQLEGDCFAEIVKEEPPEIKHVNLCDECEKPRKFDKKEGLETPCPHCGNDIPF